MCSAADGLNGWVVSRIDHKTKLQIDLFRLNSKHGLHAQWAMISCSINWPFTHYKTYPYAAECKYMFVVCAWPASYAVSISLMVFDLASFETIVFCSTDKNVIRNILSKM